ncbi:MAG TPA: FAD-dependent oxidoreductase [Saprospiraceae bacterium]|nr:FAD-dependent oxidoreductase [Saprospiraceae bacterium]
MNYDQIIVGQGIAGTLLAIRLMHEGQKVLILDNQHRTSSSITAAGIINPITGRHFTKSWKINELLPEARQTYLKLEEDLGVELWNERNILRTFHNALSDNLWNSKSDHPDYNPYIVSKPDLGDWLDKIHKPLGYGEIKGSAQVDLALLIQKFRDQFKDVVIDDHFAYHEVRHFQNLVRYKGYQCRQLVFCEGAQVIYNPFFQYLPHRPVKGEALLIHLPGSEKLKMLRDRMFIAPMGKNRCWVGSGYDHADLSHVPTKSARQKILSFLDSLLLASYEIIEHKAAIRPAVIDRRPLLGKHPKLQNLYIFNGLGTKGASLAPYFSKSAVSLLLHNQQPDPEVDIQRFLL